MSELAINSKFDRTGLWWDPGRPGLKVPGTLVWDGQRAELALDSGLVELKAGPIGTEVIEFPVLHGSTSRGEHVSLIGASRAGWSLHMGSAGVVMPEKYLSYHAVVGALIDPEVPLVKFRARIPGLPIWFEDCGIDVDRRHAGGSDVGARSVLTISVRKVEIEPIPLPNAEGTVSLEFTHNLSRPSLGQASVSTAGWVVLSCASARPFNWHLDQLGKLTKLLSLLAGMPMAPDLILSGEPARPGEVAHLVSLQLHKHCDATHPRQFTMSHGGLGTDIHAVIRRWFEIHDQFDTESGLAHAVLLEDSLWSHVEFLLLVQCLEGLHRSIFGLARKSLRARFEDLASRLPEPIRGRILGDSEDAFRDWVTTRDYYTHWDPELKKSALGPLEMHQACERMRHLLRTLYMDLVGIPSESIEAYLGNSSSASQYLAQINAATRRRSEQDSAGPSAD